MSESRFDVLVVGAGPAGSSAAAAAARKGARVLMVERRETIGVPVRCAEFIPAMLLGELEIDKGFIVQPVKGMKTHIGDHAEKTTRAPGYIIRRDRFDQTLAEKARTDGVQVMTGTRVSHMDADGRVYLTARCGPGHVVEPRIVIGADGPHSTVGRWAGLVNRGLLPAVQVTLPLTRPLDHNEVYFHPTITAGYGWLFPKGDSANVGLGMRTNERDGESIGKTLDRFVTKLRRMDKVSGDPTSRTAGWIPVEPLSRTVHGPIALVGDAAGHTHAVTGAGVFAAVVCGRMAGKWAGEAARNNDIGLLEKYEQGWRDFLGRTLWLARERRRKMEAEWDRFADVIPKCWPVYREYYAKH